MRQSRRVASNAITKMNPPEVVINSGSCANYWASASQTTDKWHMASPYTNWLSYFGRNDNRVDHIMAICVKTSSFSGKAKRFNLRIRSTGYWGWAAGMDCMWQLSKHNWSTEAAWQAGSKSYYSTKLSTTAPADPHAVAHGNFVVNNTSTLDINLGGNAEILPNTEYAIYIWVTGTYTGQIVEVAKPDSTQPVITLYAN